VFSKIVFFQNAISIGIISWDRKNKFEVCNAIQLQMTDDMTQNSSHNHELITFV
jgi:hypothetical protein